MRTLRLVSLIVVLAAALANLWIVHQNHKLMQRLKEDVAAVEQAQRQYDLPRRPDASSVRQ